MTFLTREGRLRWVRPAARSVARMLTQGTPLFLSTSAIGLYTAASGLVLGFVSTREEVAYFGAAQRIVTAGSMALNPLQQLLYPRMSHRLFHEPAQALRDVNAVLALQGGAGLLVSIAVFAFADSRFGVLFGSAFSLRPVRSLGLRLFPFSWLSPASLPIT